MEDLFSNAAKFHVKEKECLGIVVEVFKGDWVMSKCQNGELKKGLASIRSTKLEDKVEGKKTKKTARPLYQVPFLYDCREFLRERLIRRKVTTKLDYITPIKDQMPKHRSYIIFVNGRYVAEVGYFHSLQTGQ